MKNSKVVIGTWPLSGDFGPVGLKKIHEVLEHCYNIGFKEYDTAPNYGNGFMEFCLNKVFHDKPDVKINTKIGNIPFHGKSFDLNDLKRSFEQSLKRLSGLAINVLFLHNPRNEVDDFNPLVDFMNEMKLQGKIKYLGVSRARDFIYDRVLNLNHFDVIQDDMNLLYRPNNFAPNKKFFMARSPLASGILSGKMKIDTAFSQEDHRSGWLKEERLISLIKRVDAIRKISNLEIPSLSRKFLLQHQQVDKIIFGVKQIEHINDIKTDLVSPVLDPTIIEALNHLYLNDFGLKNEKHLGF